MSVLKCFIFQDLERLTEVFGGMSAGISGRKLPLWADFSFLTDGPNCQSQVFSESGQLSQAIPQVHLEQILHRRMPIALFESQCNERRVYEDQILCFYGGGMTANER